jgi:demethylmenaquinone methyltransferase/2-methoxy-6-polyprenyl-1,4-benzoquinol methylase
MRRAVMSDRAELDPEVAALLKSQRTFYDLRAHEYGNESRPDRKVSGLMPPEMISELVEEFRPAGDILEFACGTGAFTGALARRARSVTAVDASAQMLAINQSQLEDPKVRYVSSDIFNWKPDRVYDAVFFAFWLSHVPPTAFDEFWAMVRSCLATTGRVAFVDEDERAAGHEFEARRVGGTPAAPRTLGDGREFEIVKVFWRPRDLEDRLRLLKWNVEIRRVGETFVYGVCSPAGA